MPPFFEFIADVALQAVAIPFLASFLPTAAASWICSIPLRRMPPGGHWSVVARNYWPLRQMRAFALIWIVCVAYFSPSEVVAHWGFGIRFLILIAVFCGCLSGFRIGMLWIVLPECASVSKIRYLAARLLLAPGIPSMFLLMALTIGSGMGRSAIWMAAAILLVNVALNLGGSIAILKLLGILRPIGDSIEQVARNLAAAENAPLRSVMSMDLGIANAFAAPWTRDILITDIALVVLNQDELQSVIAHEVGHLKESRATGAKRLVILLPLIALGLAPAAMVAGHFGIALAIFVGFLVTARLINRHHKGLELTADKVAKGSQDTEGTYARGLEKLHVASLIPAVMDERNPYPSLYDRMESAGITPDFQRPAPPGRALSWIASVSAAVTFHLLWSFLRSSENSIF